MTKKEKLRRLIGDIHYQCAMGEYTFGPCARGCGNGARGSGTCEHCLQIDLAQIVGAKDASGYVTAVKKVKQYEYEFQNHVIQNTQAD